MYCWYIVCCFDNGMVIIVIGGFIFFREVDKMFFLLIKILEDFRIIYGKKVMYIYFFEEKILVK